MFLHKAPFYDGNLESWTTNRPVPLLVHHSADLVVCLTTMRVLKDRYAARTETPHRVLARLYEAIEADEKVLVLT
jgi:hypothetical protein